MFPLEIILLGLALAIDAAVVTFATSMLHRELTPAGRLKNGAVVSLFFGLFQFAMLWLGSYAGYLFTFSSYGYYFQMGVGAIFFGLALKCVQESLSNEEKRVEWGLIPIVILAFATSLDALAAGTSLGTIPNPYFAAIEVGLITSLVCASFYFIGQFFKAIPDRLLLRFAALIFLFLGSQTIWSLRNIIFKG